MPNLCVLTPPTAAQLPAPLRFDSVDAAQTYLIGNGIGYVLAQFVDIHGVAKAKSVPVAHSTTI